MTILDLIIDHRHLTLAAWACVFIAGTLTGYLLAPQILKLWDRVLKWWSRR